MKKINYRIVSFLMGVAAIIAAGGGGLWMYYDSGGGLGAMIIGSPVADSSTPGDLATSRDINSNVGASGEDDSIATTAAAGTVTTIDPAATVDDPLSSITNNGPISDIPPESISSETTSGSMTNAVPPAAAITQKCTFPDIASASVVSSNIILNEIAWMGSLPATGEASSKASNREWIELKNISGAPVDLMGWQILDVAGSLKVIIGNPPSDTETSTASTIVPPGGFYLLVRDGQSVVASASNGFGATTIVADTGYTGSLSNSGEKLALVNPSCILEDFLDASTGWPGGNAATKQTLERDAVGASGLVGNLGWHTSAAPGGTPRAENSTPASYLVSISSTGNGAGTVSGGAASSTSNDNIACGFTCEESYVEGTKMILTATPGAGSIFNGWSGGCATKNTSQSPSPTCSFVVSSSIALVADFEQVPTTLAPTIQVAGTSASTETIANTSSTDSSPTGASPHLLVAAIQIAGASSSNDFVKIFNPSGMSVDISGWKLHKKSSTGTDYSLKTLGDGSMVEPSGYYVWANAEGGFADSIGADASSTETLSADNSVALFDVNGNIVDQVAWGTGTNQYVEGAVFPVDPVAGQVLARKSANGALVDTNNNAEDFTLE